MSGRFKAHAALLASTLFFGINYSVAKSLMPVYISPLPLVLLRLSGSIAVLLIISAFFGFEKIQKRDYWRLALCGFTGVTINQIFFFEGLSRTSPVETALIHTSSPVLVVLFSTLLLHEKFGFLKYAGIAGGAAGAIMLVLNGKDISIGSEHFTGNLLILVNITAYALYLVLVKPLMSRYSAVTVMKWVFICGFVFILPYAATTSISVPFENYTSSAWTALIYVVFITTLLAFTLTVYSLKHVSPGVAGYYIYLQPLIASFIGISAGYHIFNLKVIIAAILIFTGVFLVNYRPRAIIKGGGKE
jgi:drug/metabolite transporter (DMT)-like permease